jgi:predicted HTH transcriptional regulator
MARDVSAFANADGGQIVYGMKENKDHEPDGLDAGLDPREYPEIWFEQVLQQHVTPLLTTVKPRHVPLSNGRVAVVIDIPASNTDPHQVDGRYYRRHNFNRLMMEHYEVRDMFRRSTNPDLTIDFYFDKMLKYHDLHYPSEAEDSAPMGMTPVISNRSELSLKVGDGGNREGGISWGCLTPPLLHQRSDMPCPKITSSS